MNSELELNPDQLRQVREVLRSRIALGLAQDDQEIKAIPAYQHPPGPNVEGSALVVDVGGTNMRAAIVALDKGDAVITAGPIERPLPLGEDGASLSADEFFDAQAALTVELEPSKGLPVGYCFSYPSRVWPDHDATLIRWTKGLRIEGVEGTRVGARLLQSIRKVGLEPGRVSVLNDTVASVLGGSYMFRGNRARVIGLIVGTGTNMAGYFVPEAVKKIRLAEPTAINLESGNFAPPHLTRFDEELAREMIPAGLQRFEKAVSGHYLPYLFKQIMPRHELDPAKGSRPLVALCSEGGEAGALAQALLTRSANLVAAGLAAVADFYPGSEDIGILAEGSLFWGDPAYAPRVESTLTSLAGGGRSFRFLQLDNANLVGSACAALA